MLLYSPDISSNDFNCYDLKTILIAKIWNLMLGVAHNSAGTSLLQQQLETLILEVFQKSCNNVC